MDQIDECPAGAPAKKRRTPQILQPGRNCWQIAPASKAAVLIDAAAYFARLEEALRIARRSVFIVGWDFDGRIRLRQDAPPEDSPPLGDLLRSLVESRPDLEIRILVWSVAVVHSPSAPLPLLLGAEWQHHPRLHLRLDTRHPAYAAHHQKIVTIDDDLAFAGGVDLTVRRWDRPAHACDEPARRDPDGNAYAPVHDVQMAVAGNAARALADIARGRWRLATGEDVPALPTTGKDPWPRRAKPDFRDVPVAIARTEPGRGPAASIKEAAALTIDALRAARRHIYIEAQYLTSPAVGAVLAERLEEENGPEILLVLSRECEGVVESLVMGKNRTRLLTRLARADRHGRLLACHPVAPGPAGECGIQVHSKLIVVDDVFLRVGSSNLNNRSIGLDTECDLAIEAGGRATRVAIRRIRDTLLAEHLGVEPSVLAREVEASGSLISAIERHRDNPRALRHFPDVGTTGATQPIFGTGILDPEEPFKPLQMIRYGLERVRHSLPA